MRNESNEPPSFATEQDFDGLPELEQQILFYIGTTVYKDESVFIDELVANVGENDKAATERAIATLFRLDLMAFLTGNYYALTPEMYDLVQKIFAKE